MRNIAVTGSSGFVGKYLCENLCKKYKIIKIGNRKKIQNLKNIKKFDMLFHLAFKKKINNENDNLQNILITKKLLDHCIKYKSSMIFISTFNTDPHTSKFFYNSKYILSKKHCEDLCKLYANKYGVNIIILRTFNIYDYRLIQGGLFKKIINNYKNKKITYLYKNFSRDYIHIEDFISCIQKIIQRKINKFKIFELGSGKTYSNLKIVNLFKKNGIDLKKINFIENKSFPVKTRANITKIKSFYKWSPKVNLEDSIKIFIKNL